MEKYGNKDNVPEDSMGEPSGESTDYRGLSLHGVSEKQISELVRNLCEIMSDTSVDSISRLLAYVRRWVSKNVDLEAYDKEGAFFEGFYVGGRFIKELYAPYDDIR